MHAQNLFGWEDWKKFLIGKTIVTQLDEPVDGEQFISTVESRSFNRDVQDARLAETKNAVKGPNGLLRHKLDGVFCIGHGETWDLLDAFFS